MKNSTKLLVFACILFFSSYQAKSQHVYAYITNSTSNNLSVIDVTTNTVISTVGLGAGAAPYAVTVLPNGNAYVADNGSDLVSIFSTTGNSIIGTIPVGSGPLSIAASPDGSKVYVTNTNVGTVSVINTATNTVTSTITVGGNPTGVVVSPDGNTVYVADGIAGVDVINATNNTVTATISTGASTLPRGVAITPDGQFLYEVNGNASTVGVYKTSDNSLFATIPVGGGAFGVAISPDGSMAYVTNSSGSVSVIDVATNTVTTTIPDGGGNQPLGVSFTPDGTKAFVVNYGAGNVSVINTTTQIITSSIGVGSNPTSFSSFIADVPFALPIHFTNFSAQELSNRSIQLSWKVQDQTQGTYYEVESSNNGILFSKKATISSSQHANATYSWTDILATPGTSFYRIKSVETSGMITYSQVLRMIVGSGTVETLIYPNPVKGKTFALQLSNQAKGLYTIEIVNIAGQRVVQTQINYTGATLTQTLNLPQIVSRGVYQVILRNGSNKTVLKLIIE